jgi:hypothetical protein
MFNYSAENSLPRSPISEKRLLEIESPACGSTFSPSSLMTFFTASVAKYSLRAQLKEIAKKAH